MQVDRIILALALVASATPVLAEKCSVCDFSDEPIVVTPKQASAPAGRTATALTGGQAGQRSDEWGKPTPVLLQPLTMNERSSGQSPADLTTEPTTKEGTFFGKVVRAGMELARRERERQQQAAEPIGEPVTFTARVTPEPRAGNSDRVPTEHISMVYEKIIWKNNPDAGSSKPKEIVVVGSKLDPAAGLPTPNKADGQHALTSVQHAARLPAPTVVAPTGPTFARGAGAPALPAKVEFGAAPAARR